MDRFWEFMFPYHVHKIIVHNHLLSHFTNQNISWFVIYCEDSLGGGVDYSCSKELLMNYHVDFLGLQEIKP
jgi:hypothetical protein